MPYDIDLGDAHESHLAHSEFCEIIFRSNIAVNCYDQDSSFDCVCTVTLTFKIHVYDLESRL